MLLAEFHKPTCLGGGSLRARAASPLGWAGRDPPGELVLVPACVWGGTGTGRARSRGQSWSAALPLGAGEWDPLEERETSRREGPLTGAAPAQSPPGHRAGSGGSAGAWWACARASMALGCAAHSATWGRMDSCWPLPLPSSPRPHALWASSEDPPGAVLLPPCRRRAHSAAGHQCCPHPSSSLGPVPAATSGGPSRQECLLWPARDLCRCLPSRTASGSRTGCSVSGPQATHGPVQSPHCPGSGPGLSWLNDRMNKGTTSDCEAMLGTNSLPGPDQGPSHPSLPRPAPLPRPAGSAWPPPAPH